MGGEEGIREKFFVPTRCFRRGGEPGKYQWGYYLHLCSIQVSYIYWVSTGGALINIEFYSSMELWRKGNRLV